MNSTSHAQVLVQMRAALDAPIAKSPEGAQAWWERVHAAAANLALAAKVETSKGGLFLEHEYIVVSDSNSKVLLSTEKWGDAVKLANCCRDSGGAVTIFKSTKG